MAGNYPATSINKKEHLYTDEDRLKRKQLEKKKT